MGAMENAGAVTLRDEYLPRSRQDASFYEFRCSVILHEMAHMWFGDLVTMKWWDDLWLNESFAEWACYHAAVEATEFDESWTGFTNARKNWALRQDQLPSTHPIAADNYDLQAVEVNFDGITYAKGASVLKQLVAWVGLDNFLVGLRAYFQRARVRQLRVQRPAQRARGVLGPRARLVGQGVAADQRREHADPAVRGRRRRQLHAPSRCCRPPRSSTRRCAVTGSASASTTRSDGRRAPGPSYARGGGRRGRDHRDRRAGRRTPARPAAAQRRRPDLRQDPPRRALAGDRGRRPLAPRRLAGPGAVLGRGVGHDPRRRDARHRLRRARARQHRGRDRRVRLLADPRVRRPGRQQLLRTRPTGPSCARPGSRASAGCSTRPSRAATTSSPSRGRSPRAAHTDAGLDELEGLLDGSARHRRPDHRHRPALDACCAGWPVPAAPTRSGSPRSCAATTPSPARSAPPPRGPRVRRPRPRRRPGRSRSCATTCPTRPSAASCSPSCSTGQDELLAPYVEKYLEVAETLWEEKGTQRASTALEFLFPRPLASRELLDRVGHLAAGLGGEPGREALRARGRRRRGALPAPGRRRTPASAEGSSPTRAASRAGGRPRRAGRRRA